MSEPLTVYECRVGRPDCDSFLAHAFVCGGCGANSMPVRVFREEDVRKLWDVCYDDSGHHLAPDEFPAPEDWPR